MLASRLFHFVHNPEMKTEFREIGILIEIIFLLRLKLSNI